jgi:hypothetical protein
MWLSLLIPMEMTTDVIHVAFRWKLPEKKTGGAIPLTDDGILAEHQGLRSFLGAGQLARTGNSLS